jgi:hypothetical protein
VQRQDEAAERAKRTATTWAIILLVVGIPLLFLFAVGVFPLAGSAYFFFRRGHFTKLDIENRKLEVVTGTLVALAPEFRPRRALGIQLDFSAYTAHKTPGAGQAFAHRWLVLSLPLQDGSHVQVEVTLLVKQKSRSKRKYTKIKARLFEEICIRVTPPRGEAFRARAVVSRSGGKAVAGLALRRGSVQPRQGIFVWSTPITFHLRTHGRWAHYGARSMDSRQLIAAIIASYKLTATGERHAH